MLLHGDKDNDVPYEQSVNMYNALKAHGLTTELVTYAGGKHEFDFYKEDTNIPSIINKAFAFVKTHI